MFKVNGNLFYAHEPLVRKNTFLGAAPEIIDLPTYDNSKDLLPEPIFEGHESTVACYHKAWEIAFRNLRNPNGEAGFVSPFIDTAFNNFLFMWDSSFITMFGKYGVRAFDFERTLDNFYSHQHKDGFICREICEYENGEQFAKDDPASTGPNILPLAEWESYLVTGDKERLRRVFYPLLAFYRWMQLNRTWQDGSYYSCGLACGMDNQPRQPKGYNHLLSHGHMAWIDTCAQQYMGADILLKMADELGEEEKSDAAFLVPEKEMLGKCVNEKMWDEKEGFYFDTLRDGSHSSVKSIAAYWTLIASLATRERAERLCAHLDNENEFKRLHRVPALPADDPNFHADAGYWNGGVWAPTNYMVLKGLTRYGFDALAYEIACNHVENVVKVFEKEGTVFENYSPDLVAPGNPAKGDFVGWTGLAPIAVLFEYVFGIRADRSKNEILWDVRRTERHGILRYPFGSGTVDLVCESRRNENERPTVTVRADSPFTLRVRYAGGEYTVDVKA